MLYVREFEFFVDGDYITAEPREGPGGATFGENFEDAVESAADWLSEVVDDALMNGKTLTKSTYGHDPRHGGRVVAVAVNRELSDIPAMTAEDAARKLDVSHACIIQMIDEGLFDSWTDGRHRMVSRASVEARKEEKLEAGH